MTILLVVLLALCLLFGLAYVLDHRRLIRFQREQFIRAYVFPESLLQTLTKKHVHLVEKDLFLVARALREYFLVRARAGSGLINMPSKVVDDLWHEFILDTKAYQRFCQSAFGEFFHHVPAASTPKGVDIDGATRRAWRYACREENINPSKPTRLPLLFAIDAKLSIQDGNKYNLKQQFSSAASGANCGGVACGGVASCGDGGGGGVVCGGGCGGGCGGS